MKPESLTIDVQFDSKALQEALEQMGDNLRALMEQSVKAAISAQAFGDAVGKMSATPRYAYGYDWAKGESWADEDGVAAERPAPVALARRGIDLAREVIK